MFYLAPKFPAPKTQAIAFASNGGAVRFAVIFGNSRRAGVPSINSVPIVPLRTHCMAWLPK